MDIQKSEAWFTHVLASLPEDKICSEMSESNADWEYIDSEMVKLGSLTHGQLDLEEIQRRTLKLLADESKDFRLVVHLLRSLQHGGKAAELLLAMQILTKYVEHYWVLAWPQKIAHKNRFALQVIKRFETAAISFANVTTPVQRDALLGECAHLAQLWKKTDNLLLSDAADELFVLYQRRIQAQAAEQVRLSEQPIQAPLETSTDGVLPAFQVSVENHDDKSWRQTLLKVAEQLCKQHPQSSTGYRLRRHALWQNIVTAPPAEQDGRTPLAAFPADLMSEYQTRLPSATQEFWEQVEKSILLAPYWFDGHCLSARIAAQLGFSDTAEAIRDELNLFLNRIPLLKVLQFTDKTPFLAEQTQKWLEENHTHKKVSGPSSDSDGNTKDVWHCFSEQGLIPALHVIDEFQQQTREPRQQFYWQYLGAQLLEKSGMAALALQQYTTLHQTARQMTLPDWEPALLEQLKVKITTEQ